MAAQRVSCVSTATISRLRKLNLVAVTSGCLGWWHTEGTVYCFIVLHIALHTDAFLYLPDRQKL